MADREAIERLELGDHVCWAFDDDRVCQESMARYVAAGLTVGHKVLYFTHAWRPEALLAFWESRGVPTRSAGQSGQLAVHDAAKTYLDGGRFDPEAAIDAWPREARLARQEGWSGLRVVGDMAWAGGPSGAATAGADRLLWYEAQVNTVFAQGEAMAVCLYDRRLFTRDELADLSAVHPGTVVDRPAAGWGPLMRMRYTDQPAGLRLSGAADISNRAALAFMLRQLPQALGGNEQLVVDVSELGFADAATAAMLAGVTGYHSIPVSLRGVSPALRKLLGIVTRGAWVAEVCT